MESNTNVKFNEHEIGAEALATMDKVDAVATAPEAKVSLMTNGAEALIPEEELGMEATEENEYKAAEDMGFFSEVIGMARVETEDGLTFYANIHKIKGGRINYEIRLQLPNGGFSPMITVSRYELSLAVSNDFKADALPTRELTNDLKKFLTRIVKDFVDMGLEYNIPYTYNILRTLYNISKNDKNKLPVYSEQDDQSERMEFYRKVVDAINERTQYRMPIPEYTAKAYYPLLREDMNYIANQFKLSATELAKKLDRFGFLYRTTSSTGYQVKIRVSSDEEAKENGVSAFENFYCVLKLDYISQQRLNAKKP